MQSTINCCSCTETDKGKGFQDLSPSIQNSVKKIITSEAYRLCNVEIKELNTGGGNFLAELYEICIKGETAEGEKEINLFVKQKIVLENIKFVCIDKAYVKEEFAYNKLSKVFTLIQDEANVPPNQRFNMPKSYEETDDSTIILENLNKKGFTTYDRMKLISLKYAELGVKELARFHGLSFVIEQKMPEYFERKIKSLEHSFNYDDDWKVMMKNIVMYIANLYDGEIKTKIQKALPVFIEKFPKYNNDQTSIKCTLSHGDFRLNNVLVREENGQPVEVVLVDYQLIDFGCPIRDLLFFIFSSTDQDFRRLHLNYLKELYFDTLSEFLKYFKIDVEDVYPKKYFDKIYSEWLDFGLLVTVYSAVFLFAPETGLDLRVLTLSEIPTEFDEEVDNRFRGLIDDFLEWGYL
ncbi:unnamed protein product, partial [Brenthis ino]